MAVAIRIVIVLGLVDKDALTTLVALKLVLAVFLLIPDRVTVQRPSTLVVHAPVPPSLHEPVTSTLATPR